MYNLSVSITITITTTTTNTNATSTSNHIATTNKIILWTDFPITCNDNTIVRVVKSRRMRWAGHVARMGEGRRVHRLLVGKPEGKRPLGRPRCRWEDNIKMDLQKVGGVCEDWMELAQDRDRWRAFVSTVMNLRVSKMRGISWLAAEPVGFSRRTLLHGVSK